MPLLFNLSVSSRELSFSVPMEKISLTPLSLILISSILALSFLFSLLRPRKTPTPSTYPLIGNLLAFLRNRHRFLDWVSDLLSQTPSNTLEVRTLFFTTPGVCTADPANVEHLLKTNFSNYVKGPRFYTPFSDLLGDGIFNVDGRLWTHQRKIASHEFNTRSLRSFVLNAVQAEIETQLFPALLSASESGEVLDLDALLRKFTFDNICSLAFGDVAGGGGASSAREFVRAFDIAAEICFDRALTPVPWVWKAKRFFNVGSERRLREAIRTVDEYAMKIIDSREGKDSGEKMDLLSRFIYAEEELISEDDKHQRRKFLRDIIISFILAGKDSTSTALTWFFWLISENPRCEKRIHEEIAQVEAARRRENEEEGVLMIFGYEELKKMNYLQAAISESLRLYPPVPINSRVAVRDDVLPDGTRVGAGWFADYSAYAMGRMEKVWGAECREFVPERWLDEGEFVAADQFRFPVFHGGQRVCLGREMAYLQMKAVAAAVVGGYWVERVEGGRRREAPAYTMSLTLKMKGGFPVRMRKK